MVRKQAKVDLSWFDYTPEVLVWGQVKRVLRKYKLPVQDFNEYIEHKPRPIYEYENGDLTRGYLTVDFKKYLKSRLIPKKVKTWNI